MSIIKDFKDFINRGNVLDLAVAVVIGAAFGAITISLVDDIIMPLLGMFLGGSSFGELKYVLKEAVGEETPEVAVLYGKFILTLINFLIIAFAVFLIVRIYKNMQKKEEENKPAPAPPSPSNEEILLAEIRDLLKK